jgi:hypothetical protein
LLRSRRTAPASQHVLINTVRGHQKVKNIDRDPRVAVSIADPDHPSRYFEIRGRVLTVTSLGAAENIEKLAQRYLGMPYPWFGGRDQQRLLLTIGADKINAMG